MSTDPLPLVTDLALRLMNLYSRLRFCDLPVPLPVQKTLALPEALALPVPLQQRA